MAEKKTKAIRHPTCWAANLLGMLRAFKKLSEKGVFEHIFYHFMPNFAQKLLKKVENDRFPYNFLNVRSIPDEFAAQNIWKVETHNMDQKPLSLRSQPYPSFSSAKNNVEDTFYIPRKSS